MPPKKAEADPPAAAAKAPKGAAKAAAKEAKSHPGEVHVAFKKKPKRKKAPAQK